MFSEVINTICVLVSVSLLFLGATTHKYVKQVEKKIDLLMYMVEDSESESESDSESDSESESESDSEYSYSSFPNCLEFKPFIEKSSSLPDFKDYKIKERSMSF